MAHGNHVESGFGAGGSDGSKITVKIPSAGRIPNGATVERPAPTTLGGEDSLVLNLNNADFTTAKRVADAINDSLGAGMAVPLAATSLAVHAPRARGQRVSFISVLEHLTLEPGATAAEGVIN